MAALCSDHRLAGTTWDGSYLPVLAGRGPMVALGPSINADKKLITLMIACYKYNKSLQGGECWKVGQTDANSDVAYNDTGNV
jgi:hypothetical protein